MSKTNESVQTVRKIVVFFDICSSTTILEDLLRTENQTRWRNLLIRLKSFLRERAPKTPFEVYKFLGDGWVLLLDPDKTKGSLLMELLFSICYEYERLFHRGICEVLECAQHQIGITFGIDTGTLVRIVMNQQIEYVGRPLNVAARLQSVVKQHDKKPAGKLLISKNAFAQLRLSTIKKYQSKLIDTKLRNISGGDSYQARFIDVCK